MGAPAGMKTEIGKMAFSHTQGQAKQNSNEEWRGVVQQPGPPKGWKREFIKEGGKEKKNKFGAPNPPQQAGRGSLGAGTRCSLGKGLCSVEQRACPCMLGRQEARAPWGKNSSREK